MPGYFGSTTNLKAWVGPGAEYSISDKTPDTGPAAERDGTRITGPRPAILTGAYYDILDKTASSTGAVRDDTQITQPRIAVLTGGVVTIADKTPTSEFAKYGTDTYLSYVSLGDTGTLEIFTTETWRPVHTLTGVPTITVASAQNWTPTITFVGLPPTAIGALPVFGSDTYAPLTAFLTIAANIEIATTESYVPVVTEDSGTGPEKVDLKSGTDTYTPVLYQGYRITISTTVAKSTTDIYLVTISQSSAVTPYLSDVDNINIVGGAVWTIRIRPA